MVGYWRLEIISLVFDREKDTEENFGPMGMDKRKISNLMKEFFEEEFPNQGM